VEGESCPRITINRPTSSLSFLLFSFRVCTEAPRGEMTTRKKQTTLWEDRRPGAHYSLPESYRIGYIQLSTMVLRCELRQGWWSLPYTGCVSNSFAYLIVKIWDTSFQ
jgi:hypothetical protein